MNKKFNSYIRDFGKKFKLKIHLLNSLIDVNKYDETEFKKFLDSFNNFNLLGNHWPCMCRRFYSILRLGDFFSDYGSC